MVRESTGIPGLNALISGGFVKSSVNAVLGGTGTGKTTFALQFLLEGLESGQDGLYITMEQSKESIIANARKMGFEHIEKYVDTHLCFIETGGSEFKEFIQERLPELVQQNVNFERETRVVVDPLTALLWEVPDKNEQRKLIEFLYNQIRRIGTSVVTVEQYGGTTKELLSEDVGVPLFLADSAINLIYLGFEGEYSRIMKILKMRGTKHSESLNQVFFNEGIGLAVISQAEEFLGRKPMKADISDVIEPTVAKIEASDLSDTKKEILISRARRLNNTCEEPSTGKRILNVFLSDFGLADEEED